MRGSCDGLIAIVSISRVSWMPGETRPWCEDDLNIFQNVSDLVHSALRECHRVVDNYAGESSQRPLSRGVEHADSQQYQYHNR